MRTTTIFWLSKADKEDNALISTFSEYYDQLGQSDDLEHNLTGGGYFINIPQYSGRADAFLDVIDSDVKQAIFIPGPVPDLAEDFIFEGSLEDFKSHLAAMRGELEEAKQHHQTIKLQDNDDGLLDALEKVSR